MGNIQLKILSSVLVLLLLVLLWVQHKLNSELSSQLSLAKQEISTMKESIKNSTEIQNAITDDINALKAKQLIARKELHTRLASNKAKPITEQPIVLTTEYIKILDCIETVSIGGKCE